MAPKCSLNRVSEWPKPSKRRSKRNQYPSKMDPKSSQIGSRAPLGATLARHTPKVLPNDPPRLPKWPPRRPQDLPKWSRNRSKNVFKIKLKSNLDLSSIVLPKQWKKESKLGPNRSKIETKTIREATCENIEKMQLNPTRILLSAGLGFIGKYIKKK